MMVSVCVPMYNESVIIADTAKALFEYMSKRYGNDFEIIFSDDGSIDGSAGIIKNLGLPNVRVVGYEKNQGKGCAVRNGILASKGDVIVFTDADLAYGIEIIESAISKIQSGKYDVLVASRSKHPRGYDGYTPIRRLASKTYIKLLNVLGGIEISDSQCGFKVFDGEKGRRIFSLCKTCGFAFDLEVILLAQKMGFRMFEMPAMIVNHRESKVNVFRDAPRMIAEAVRIKNRVQKMEI